MSPYPSEALYPSATTYPEHPAVPRRHVYEKTILRMGPSMLITMDDIYGAGDLTTNHYDGTTQGSFTPGGRRGPLAYTYSGATELDGVNDRVSVPGYTNVFNNSAQRTFCIWAQCTDTSVDQALWGGTGAGTSPHFMYLSTGDIRFRIVGNNATATSSKVWTGLVPAQDTWALLVLTLDTANDTARLFVNAQAQTQTTGLTATFGTTGDFNFGARQGATNPFQGLIAYMIIFEKLLTLREVRTLWKAGHDRDVK